MRELNKDYTDFYNIKAEKNIPHRGDLCDMLYPTGKKCPPEKKWKWAIATMTSSPLATKKTIRDGTDLNILTKNPNKTLDMTMFRDSFGNNLRPFLSEEFKNPRFTRQMPYNLTEEASEKSLRYAIKNYMRLYAEERLQDRFNIVIQHCKLE